MRSIPQVYSMCFLGFSRPFRSKLSGKTPTTCYKDCQIVLLKNMHPPRSPSLFIAFRDSKGVLGTHLSIYVVGGVNRWRWVTHNNIQIHGWMIFNGSNSTKRLRIRHLRGPYDEATFLCWINAYVWVVYDYICLKLRPKWTCVTMRLGCVCRSMFDSLFEVWGGNGTIGRVYVCMWLTDSWKSVEEKEWSSFWPLVRGKNQELHVVKVTLPKLEWSVTLSSEWCMWGGIKSMKLGWYCLWDTMI